MAQSRSDVSWGYATSSKARYAKLRNRCASRRGSSIRIPVASFGQSKHVAHLTVVALGPKLPTGMRIDEPRRDAHLFIGFADGAFEDIAYPQLTSDLLCTDALALIEKRRIAGGYEQFRKF